MYILSQYVETYNWYLNVDDLLENHVISGNREYQLYIVDIIIEGDDRVANRVTEKMYEAAKAVCLQLRDNDRLLALLANASRGNGAQDYVKDARKRINYYVERYSQTDDFANLMKVARITRAPEAFYAAFSLFLKDPEKCVIAEDLIDDLKQAAAGINDNGISQYVVYTLLKDDLKRLTIVEEIISDSAYNDFMGILLKMHLFTDLGDKRAVSQLIAENRNRRRMYLTSESPNERYSDIERDFIFDIWDYVLFNNRNDEFYSPLEEWIENRITRMGGDENSSVFELRIKLYYLMKDVENLNNAYVSLYKSDSSRLEQLLLDLDYEEAEVSNILGSVALSQGDYENAKQYYQQAGNTAPLFYAGDALFEEKKYDEAYEYYLISGLTEQEAYEALAKNFFKEGNTSFSGIYLSKAGLSEEEKLYFLGNAYMEMGETEEALRYFEQMEDKSALREAQYDLALEQNTIDHYQRFAKTFPEFRSDEINQRINKINEMLEKAKAAMTRAQGLFDSGRVEEAYTVVRDGVSMVQSNISLYPDLANVVEEMTALKDKIYVKTDDYADRRQDQQIVNSLKALALPIVEGTSRQGLINLLGHPSSQTATDWYWHFDRDHSIRVHFRGYWIGVVYINDQVFKAF